MHSPFSVWNYTIYLGLLAHHFRNMDRIRILSCSSWKFSSLIFISFEDGSLELLYFRGNHDRFLKKDKNQIFFDFSYDETVYLFQRIKQLENLNENRIVERLYLLL